MGLFDKKEEGSVKRREIRIYSEMNDHNIVFISSKDVDLSNDKEVLAYIKRTESDPQWFRSGNDEYRLSAIKRVKLGKIE